MAAKVEVGSRFGGLTVLAADGLAWRCRCECGGTGKFMGFDLATGRVSHCGCRKRPPKPVSLVYRGWLRLLHNGEEDGILCLCDDPGEGRTCGDEYGGPYEGGGPQPLSAVVRDDMVRYGRYLSVRYYLFDLELSEEEMREAWAAHVMGAGKAKYGMRYSDITGYLWTDNELKVGGHDLLAELASHLRHGPCFCQLEIDYSREARPA